MQNSFAGFMDVRFDYISQKNLSSALHQRFISDMNMRLMAANANSDSKPGVFATLDRVRFIDISLTKELEHYDGDDKEECSRLWLQ